MATAVLVSGMHRSGTSATAGALNLLGVSLGTNLLGPGDDNPKGYWESTRAVDIHDKLLEQLGRSWDDIRALPGDWLEHPATVQAALEIHELIEAEFASAELWAVKDPRLCRFLPLWRRVLDERGIRAVVLIVARPPSEVAASLSKRNGWSRSVGELLWMRYVLDSELGSRGLQRSVLTYDSLLSQPKAALERALEHLDVPLQRGDIDAVDKSLAEFVDVADRHHMQSAVGNERQFSLLLWDLYVSLSDIERSGGGWEGFEAAVVQLNRFMEDRVPEIFGMADVAQGWRRRYNEQEIETLSKNSQLIAQIKWSEEAVLRERELVQSLADCRQQATANEVQDGAWQLMPAEIVAPAIDLFLADARVLSVIDVINGFPQLVGEISEAMRDLSEPQSRIVRDLSEMNSCLEAVAKGVQAIHDERDAGVLEGFKQKIHDLETDCLRLGEEKEVERLRAQSALDESMRLAVAMQSECSSLAREITTLTEEKFRLRLEYDSEHRRAEEVLIHNRRLMSSISLAESDLLKAQTELGAAQERMGELELRESDMTNVIARLAEEIRGLNERGEDLLLQNKGLLLENSAIKKSFSWRMTRPARSVVEAFRRTFSTRR